MSGTSIDAIDVAAIETDGVEVAALGPAISVPYEPNLRTAIRGILGSFAHAEEVEQAVTLAHVAAVRRFLSETDTASTDFDLVGFHGHTVAHRPDLRRTRQIGDARLLANELQIDVVGEFRHNDVGAGGQGAPLAPIYHAHLLKFLAIRGADLRWPLAVLNIGGVANVTLIEEPALENPECLLAFDTGPGNALVDDWVVSRTGDPYDRDGALAARGKADHSIVDALLDDPFFAQPPPKSLDRNAFAMDVVQDLATADGAATLTAFTVASVAKATEHLPSSPSRWLLTGGGRHNRTLSRALAAHLGNVVPIEDIGGRGDSLEAEAFAHMAVRTIRGLPLTFPGTTGAPTPLSGGVLYGGRRT